MRKKIVAGNWKMNLSIAEGANLSEEIVQSNDQNDVDVIVIPPFTHLSTIAEKIKHSNVKLGAQNCNDHNEGAYTGEISPMVLKQIGVEFVLVGHSERRQYYNESNDLLSKKIDNILKNGLTPIFCVGELLEERNSGSQYDVILKQLNESLFHLDNENLLKTVIAYEPVWAIGTGLTASPEQAQEIHKFIRGKIAEKYNNDVANRIQILYGGSCKPSNAKEIFSQNDVDGGLIGGASLNVKDFMGIVKY